MVRAAVRLIQQHSCCSTQQQRQTLVLRADRGQGSMGKGTATEALDEAALRLCATWLSGQVPLVEIGGISAVLLGGVPLLTSMCNTDI